MTEPVTRGGDLVAERLGRDGLRAAYPLIRQAEPTVDLQTWLRFARRLTGARGAASGIMAVRHVGRPFPCGLFCYRCEPDLRHGVALTADHLVALDLLDSEVVRERLLRALATLAAELGCEMVRLAVPAAPLALLLRTGLGRPALAAERADRQGPGC